MTLGTFDRARSLQQLGDTTFDVLVIGGGITGAGVALDAASARPAHGARRAGRLRQRHVVEELEARARRAALPPERRRPPRLRGARASASGCATTRPHLVRAAPVPHPDLLQGRAHQPEGRPGARQRHVDVRPHRRRPHRQAPQAAQEGRGRRPHADAARGAPRRRATSTTTPPPTTPASRSPSSAPRPRPRRRGRQPRQRRRAAPRGRPGDRRGASRPTGSASRCGPGRS